MKHIFRTLVLLAGMAVAQSLAAEVNPITFQPGDTIGWSSYDLKKWLLAGETHNNNGHYEVMLSQPKPISELSLWVVEAAHNALGEIIPNQYSFYNLGLWEKYGVKAYLTIVYIHTIDGSTQTDAYHTKLSTQKSYLQADDRGLFMQLENSSGSGSRTKMYVDAGADYKTNPKENSLTWNKPGLNPNTGQYLNQYTVYHRSIQNKVVVRVDDINDIVADGNHPFIFGYNSETHTFALPQKLQHDGIHFTSDQGEYYDINGSPIVLCDCDSDGDLPNCEESRVSNLHWGSGKLISNGATCTVYDNQIIVTSQHQPTSGTMEPLRDTLYATVTYNDLEFDLCLPIEQGTLFTEKARDLSIEIAPTEHWFTENRLDSVDFEVTGNIVFSDKTWITTNNKTPISVTDEEFESVPIALANANISLVTNELSRDWYFKIWGNNHVRVYVDQSASSVNNPSAMLKCLYVYRDALDTCEALIVQRVNNELTTTFEHKCGKTDRHLQDNGMQSVHTTTKVIYLGAGETQQLTPNEQSYFGYFRWYDYDADRASNLITISNSWDCWLNEFGFFRQQKKASDFTLNVTTPADFKRGDVIRIACDLSNYIDYTWDKANNHIVEPTLSARCIFEIHYAGEMADKLDLCTGNTYLEEYNIFASACNEILIGPKFRKRAEVADYWFNAEAPQRINNLKYYRDDEEITGSDLNLVGNHYLRTSGTAGDTVVYTMQSNGRNIARFTVMYRECSEIGPWQQSRGGLITHLDIVNKNNVLAYLNFDYDSPNTTDPVSYDVPLQPDESTYGFAFANDKDPQERRQSNASFARAFPYYGEYAFINTTKGWSNITWLASLDNISGAKNGYMLICDGSSTEGMAVSLDLQATLCAGAQMYCSAWVAAANQNDISPILQFEVVGIDDNGEEHSLSTYTTGEIPLKQGWMQVNFPIETNRDFPQYRMKVTNFAAGDQGNDFIIDEVCVYAKETAINTQQVTTVCAGVADQTVAIAARIDFSTLPFLERADYHVYYQWFNTTADSIIHADYIDATGTLPEGVLYGLAVFPRPGEEIDPSKIYNSTQEIIDAYVQDMHNKFGYVLEEVDGEERYVFYGVDIINANKYENLTLRLAYAPSDLEYTLCALSRDILILPRAELMLDGQPTGPLNTICSNQSHQLTVRIVGSGNEQSNCLADWLHGLPMDSTDVYMEDVYGYTWPQIEEALYDFRHPVYLENGDKNPNLTIGSPDAIYTEYIDNDGSNGKPATVDVITTLVHRGLLDLASDRHIVLITRPDVMPKRELYRLVFPIDGTSGIDVQVCEDPIPATFELCKPAGYELLLGNQNETDDLGNRVRAIRISATDKSFSLPVASAALVKIDSVNNPIHLIETSDPTFNPAEHNLILRATNNTFITYDVHVNGSIDLTIDEEASNFTMREGYKYTFAITLLNNGGDTQGRVEDRPDIFCPVGIVYFNVLTTPSYVAWVPEGNSTAWNNDRNWRACDEHGNLTGGGAAPQAHTNVIIPNYGWMHTYPVLNTSNEIRMNQRLATEDGAQTYITYDFGYVPNSCNNIHVDIYAQVVNQHVLNYNKAWCSFPVPNHRWHIYTTPMKGTVSGDIYTPTNRYVGAGYFTAGDTEPARTTNTFFLSLFNQKAIKKHVSESQNMDISSATWTAPVNGLSVPLNVGSGFALWTYTHDGDEIMEDYLYNPVRLPKANDKYYYTMGGKPTGIYETIERPKDYGRFGFEPRITAVDTVFTITLTNDQEGDKFVCGNPTIASLNMRKFFAYNSDVLTGTYYHIPEAEFSDQLDMSVCTPFTVDVSEMIIKPFHAAILEAKTPGTTLQVKYTPNMLCLLKEQLDMDVNFDDVSHIQHAPSEKSSKKMAPKSRKVQRIAAQNGLSLLSIMAEFGEFSTSVDLGESAEASNAYLKGEDAEMITFEGEDNWVENALTHTVLYTPHEDKALVVNIFNQLESVPLTYHCVDGEEVKEFTLWFFGVNNFPNGLQFYDSKLDVAIPIFEGFRLPLEGTASDEVRYYIQRLGYNNSHVSTGCTNPTANAEIAAYVQPNQMVRVVATETLTHIAAYSATGQIVYDQANFGNQTTEFALPQGVYVLKIATASGNTAVRKVVVK